MNTKFIKTAFCFLCLSLFISNASSISSQSRNKTKNKSKITKKLKAEDERRKYIETLLLKGEYQHDGSGELIYIGTIMSVPALLKVLEDHPPSIYNPCVGLPVEILPPPPWRINAMSPTVDSPPKTEKPKPDCTPKKSYICTYSHAVTALRKITKQNFTEYQDWENWWKEYQRNNTNK